MNKKPFFVIAGSVAALWLGSMAWLSGYKQGYTEGSETAWNDARSALMQPQPLPTLHLEMTADAANP